MAKNRKLGLWLIIAGVVLVGVGVWLTLGNMRSAAPPPEQTKVGMPQQTPQLPEPQAGAPDLNEPSGGGGNPTIGSTAPPMVIPGGEDEMKKNKPGKK